MLLGSARCGAADDSAAADRVGDLGRTECLVFEGVTTFPGAGIVGALQREFEFHGRSDPEAPLADYLGWLERTVRMGYQHAGFVRATVRATADRPSRRLHVNVMEGPRFRCGGVQVSGLDDGLTSQLTNLLARAGALGEAKREADQPSFGWAWVAGAPAPADPVTLDQCQRSVVAALAELNRHGAEVEVRVALDEDRQRAELLVRVTSPGRVGVLDRIEVDGLRVNPRDDLLEFLGLRPGLPLSGNVTNQVVRRLYESGRFLGHAALLRPLPEPGHFQLEVRLSEYTNAPPLRQGLRPGELACLKLREWLLAWRQRPEDWLLSAQATRQGVRTSAEIVLGREGLAAVVRQASAADPPALRLGLVAAPEHLGFYSGRQQSKLVGAGLAGQVAAFLELAPQPAGHRRMWNLSMGGGYRSQRGNPPYSLRLELAPVAFVALAHPGSGTCRVERGVLYFRSEAGVEPAVEITADAATGRLLTCRLTGGNSGLQVELRGEEGAHARLIRDLAAGTSGFTNALDPQHPWRSSLPVLGREVRAVLERDFPGAWERVVGAQTPWGGSREAWEMVRRLDDLPWGELFASRDIPAAGRRGDETGEVFGVVNAGAFPPSVPSPEWIRWLGGMLLAESDHLFPRGSWPWVVLRDAAFLAGGEPHWATNHLARLSRPGEIGPLGCLMAAHALGRLDPRLAVAYARLGSGRVTARALAEDFGVLLRGDEAGPRFLRAVLARGLVLGEGEATNLVRWFGKRWQPLVREAFGALKEHRARAPGEILRPVFERHWATELRPGLLACQARACLGALRRMAPDADPPAAVAAAGWLREAAGLGSAEAQMALGQLHATGFGVEASRDEAIHWLRAAAGQDHPHANCELGWLHFEQGGAQGLQEAERWFRIGAQEECARAEEGLAEILIARKGATREGQEEAIRWFQRAAGHGSRQAEFRLGTIYEQQNRLDQALEHFRRAAKKNVIGAQMRLGELLSDGWGAKQDLVEAWVWYTRAAELGDRLAAVEARRLERRLTPEQLQEAGRRLRILD